jgi:hypothetical protein
VFCLGENQNHGLSGADRPQMGHLVGKLGTTLW